MLDALMDAIHFSFCLQHMFMAFILPRFIIRARRAINVAIPAAFDWPYIDG